MNNDNNSSINDVYNNGFISQQPINEQNLYVQNSIQNSKSNKYKKFMLIILIIIAVVGIACLVYNVIFKDKNSNNLGFGKNYTAAFFLKNKEGKYALFNDDGDQLTEFIYDNASGFANGTAKVEKDNKYGIISSSGKMIVDFEKYKYITNIGGMYKVEKEDHYYLIDGNDKVLYDLENAHLTTYIGIDDYSILEADNKYTVLNYSGEKMISFPIQNNSEIPSVKVESGIMSILYNNKNYIINAYTGKTITSFDSNNQFCIKEVAENDNKIILYSCKNLSQDGVHYAKKVIDNGKVIDISDECEQVNIYENILACKIGYDNYLLDANYSYSLNAANIAYVDNNNYAQNSLNNSDGVDFYNNGAVVKNVPCRILKETGYVNGYISSNLYLLVTPNSTTCRTKYGTFEYYKTNGEKAFDKSFIKAEKFDKNGNAKVSEYEGSYYLINSDGKQVSEVYDDIRLVYDYYIIEKGSKEGVMDKYGKEILPCEYSKIDLSEKQDIIYAKLAIDESKNIIYNMKTNKQVLTVDSSIYLYEHFMNTSNNGKKQYYSYTTGKMFYEG